MAGEVSKGLSNIEAAKKGFERLNAVVDAHGMGPVVTITATFGAMCIELYGRNEGGYVAAIIGRVSDEEWKQGVGFAVDAHEKFMAETRALAEKHKAEDS